MRVVTERKTSCFLDDESATYVGIACISSTTNVRAQCNNSRMGSLFIIYPLRMAFKYITLTNRKIEATLKQTSI